MVLEGRSEETSIQALPIGVEYWNVMSITQTKWSRGREEEKE